MSDTSTRFRLSKSKIAAFEHCPRRLWLQIHRREAGHFDTDTLERFRFGHDVGARATFLIPDGIMVDAKPDIRAALDRTTALITLGPVQPIFEATFQHKDVLVRADILEPDGQGGWRIIEVKASSRVRAYQLADIATQIWVIRSCGLQVSKAIIRHLAPPFTWRRPDIAAIRFNDSDVTRQVGRYIRDRPAIAAEARRAIRGAEIERAIGPHCTRPFRCEFERHCLRTRAEPLLALI